MAKKNQNTTASLIKLENLTAEQLASLHGQISAKRKLVRAGSGSRNAVIDPMLHETNDLGHVHTTADIVVALQAKSLLPKELSKTDHAVEIKKIQTRKQLLQRKGDTSVGYRASATGFGPLTVERVLTWLESASAEDVDRVNEAINEDLAE